MKRFFLFLVGICSTILMTSQTFGDYAFTLNNTSTASPCLVDMNADGLDDVVTISNDNVNIDYQQSDGTFLLTTYEVGLQNYPNWSIAAGDIDGNGYNDLMLGGGQRISFVYANEDGTDYSEVYINDYIFSQRTNFVDIDNDGHLDAFACHDVDQNHPYRNDGNGNLTEDQTLIETIDLAGNYASVWTDFDMDGDIDMYLSKCRQGSSAGDERRENALYVNNGDGTFTEDAASYGLFDNEQSWVTIFEDFDNDGDMDCYTVNHTTSNYLRMNDGTGHYTEVTAGSGINVTDLNSWACVGADFDNDGFVDILNQSFSGNQLYHNNGDFTFTPSSLFFDRGALGDANNDGFVDVFTGTALWLNDGNDNNYLKVALEGTTSNRNGIGSRVEIYGDWGLQVRELRSGESFKPASTLDVMFGLGTATAVDSLVIKWPSGGVDCYLDVPINGRFSVIETPFTCSGDFNTDGSVDVQDFIQLNSVFGQDCSNCPEDMNKDGKVDIDDFLLFNSAYGNTCD